MRYQVTARGTSPSQEPDPPAQRDLLRPFASFFVTAVTENGTPQSLILQGNRRPVPEQRPVMRDGRHEVSAAGEESHASPRPQTRAPPREGSHLPHQWPALLPFRTLLASSAPFCGPLKFVIPPSLRPWPGARARPRGGALRRTKPLLAGRGLSAARGRGHPAVPPGRASSNRRKPCAGRARG